MTSATPAVRGMLTPQALLGVAAATGTVLGIYVVVVLGGGLLIGHTDSPHLGLSVLATAVVAFVAEPVRHRVERWASRRLHREERSPYDVLAEFSREATAIGTADHAPAVIARMLTQGTGVQWSQVWVLVDGRLQLVATYPPEAADDAAPPALYQPDARDGLRTVTVVQDGTPLGVLRVREQPGRPMTPVEDRLLGGLAAQAGMVLQTAQLRGELAGRLAELSEREQQLRRARDDLASAQDAERRRLERDIHDGAQQQLVALAINLKLAKALGGTEPDAARTVLREQLAATSEAIATLSELSAGLLPELLTRRGLGPALVAATAGNPVRVNVEAPSVRRLTPEAESALYFCALEAVQNATKHARASRIDVRLRRSAGRVLLTVEDDGTGQSGGTGRGSGLRNMRERAEAIGGDLRMTTRPHGGTTVVVDVPDHEAAVVGTG